MIRKGDIFYKAWVYLDHKDPSSIELDEYHVTHINKYGIYLTLKNASTWGKKSNKKGDYGWLSNISPYYREKLESEDYKSQNFHKTKSAAYRSVMPEMKKYKRDILRLYTKLEKDITKHQKSK